MAPCCLRPTQSHSANGGRAFDLVLCAVATHRTARAITPATISTVVKAMVNASTKSVSTIDLYIVTPCIGRIATGTTVRKGQGFTEAQTRQLCQFAWAISRRICDRHNWASNYASLVRNINELASSFRIMRKLLNARFESSRMCARWITQRGTYEELDATQPPNAEISRGSVGRRLPERFDSFFFSDAANRK